MSEIYRTIGEAADLVGMTKTRVRFYCNKGLVVPKTTPSRYRLFGDEEIGRLRLIYLLRLLDTPIGAIKTILNVDPSALRHTIARRRVAIASIQRTIPHQISVLNALNELPPLPAAEVRRRDFVAWIDELYAAATEFQTGSGVE